MVNQQNPYKIINVILQFFPVTFTRYYDIFLCKKCTIYFNTIKQVNPNSDLNILTGFISLLSKRTPKNLTKYFSRQKHYKFKMAANYSLGA